MTDLLPGGVVTFAFTDVEGSTKLWEEAAEAMVQSVGMLDELVDRSTREHGGIVVKPRGEGDSHFMVFESASGAVAALAQLQRNLSATDWPTPRPLKVRAALHSGSAEMIDGDYYGPTVNRTARLRAIAHGGQTIMSRATRELVGDNRVDGVEIRDLGRHRLKDLARPEEVFQLLGDGLPTDFPQLVSLENVPNNLSEQLTELIGREEELARALELLEDARLLTLLAPGGTGKTRLAMQVAADSALDYRDGVYVVGLADISDRTEIVQSVAEALGLGLSTDDELQSQLLKYLATKRQLLIFDNFEHVIDGSAIVTAILERCPHVTIIATSREKLGLTGEVVMPLSGLQTEWSSPEAAFQTAGVQLFIDAASRVNSSFQISEDDLEAVSRILDLTGGMPLAILLAASWVDMLNVSEIADEIGKSLDFLETEAGDVPDRHRSVRAIFDYSWALLDEAERQIFSKLSVCRGGFTRQAAESIAGASLRSISRLVSKSLVTANVENSRYSIHELLRQFAEAELGQNEGEAAEVRDEHTEFYANLVDEAYQLVAAADQVGMARVIEDDIDNVRSAWRRALTTGQGERGLKLLRGLYFLYEWRGWYPSAVAMFDEALEILDESSDDEDVARLRLMSMAVRGWFLSLMGQAERGLDDALRAHDSLPKSTPLDDLWIACQCVALGRGYTGAGDAMVEVTQEGIDLIGPDEDQFFVAGMKNWRSFAAVLGGDLDTATTLLSENSELFESRNEHYYQTWNLWLRGLVALAEERPVDAIDRFARQVEVAEELGYLRGLVVAYEGLGDANAAAGRPDESVRSYAKSIVIADQMGMVNDMLGLMTKIGGVWASNGEHEAAVQVLSTVTAEPMSDAMTFTYVEPIRDVAARTLDELTGVAQEKRYAEASAAGKALSWDVAAKRLMDGLAD